MHTTRIRLASVLGLLLVQASSCGFVAVEDCFGSLCDPRDAGVSRDGGAASDGGALRDAGVMPDAGVVLDAGVVPDAGALEDAGALQDAGLARDAGPARDAGTTSDGGCLAQLRALVTPRGGDFVRVVGQTAGFGAVDFIIGGYSAGASGPAGIQRFTNHAYAAQRLPAGVFDVGLWMWTEGGPMVAGVEYVADNDSQYSSSTPFIDFRISVLTGPSGTSTWCPPTWGRGTFTFTSFAPLPSTTSPAEGTYTFQCLDAGVDVHGCFVYAG